MSIKKLTRISIFCISAIFIITLFFTGTKSVSATDTADCVLVHGTADANISVVFMSNYGVANVALEKIYDRFKVVSPLKENLDKVAFYLDNKSASHVLSTMEESDPNLDGSVDNKNNSSCQGKTYYFEVIKPTPIGPVDIDLFNRADANQVDGIVVISRYGVSEEGFIDCAIHELAGHLIGHLQDEYRLSRIRTSQYASAYMHAQVNCVTKDIFDNYWKPYFPSMVAEGKECETFSPTRYKSSLSLMELTYVRRFNPIGCAYVALGLDTPGGSKLAELNEIVSSQEKFDTILGPYLNKCGEYKSTKFSMDIPIRTNCVPEDFLADISKDVDASADIIISAEQDIQLSPILDAGWWSRLWGNDKNFFKINDTDVSVDDGHGGRKIPAGHLKTIPHANIRDIKFKTGDQYCRDDPITLSFEVYQMSLESPFACFGSCE